ncbi:TPA: winged helix-turn-helix domain-containing protein [Vibrio alginolyticus]
MKQYLLNNRFIFDPIKSFLIDTESENSKVYIGSNENRMLHYIIIHKDRVISRNELKINVWENYGFYVDDPSITQAISTLRSALHDQHENPKFIQTYRRKGYKMIATIEGGPDHEVSALSVCYRWFKSFAMKNYKWNSIFFISLVLFLSIFIPKLLSKYDIYDQDLFLVGVIENNQKKLIEICSSPPGLAVKENKLLIYSTLDGVLYIYSGIDLGNVISDGFDMGNIDFECVFI